MRTFTFKQDSFIGGISEGSKSGYKGGYQFGQGIDFRSDRDALQAHYKLTKESSTSVTDLVKWMVEYQSDVWMYGDTGKLYKRTTVPAYTNPKTVSSSHGNGMQIFRTLNNDALWYAGDSSLGKATTLTGTAVFTDDYFKGVSLSTTNTLRANTGANTYTVPTSISEASADKKGFTTGSTMTRVESINIILSANGGGTLTITVHDGSNTLIATQTVANASLPAAGALRFDFNGGFTVLPSTAYHFHVTSDMGGSSVLTSTSSDLSTVRYTVGIDRNFKDVDQSVLNDSVISYAYSTEIKTVVSEVSQDKRTFTPSYVNLSAISVVMGFLNARDITVIVHDANNTVIAQKTVTSGNMHDGFGYWVRFEFSSVVQLIPGNEYHIHITASGAGAYLYTETDTTLSSIFFVTQFPVLNTDTNYHPMAVLGNKLLIGNRNFIATLEDTEIYNPERLQFLYNDNVRSIDVIGGYAHISTWRYDSVTKSNVTRVYIWDGVSPLFNDYLPYSGTVHAMQNSGDNQLYVLHNHDVAISVYTGAITKKRQLKNLTIGKYLEIYPGAVTVWNNILYFGISGGDATDSIRGVYSYGRRDNDVPNALGFDYPISTDNKGSTVQIGSMLGLNQTTFLVAWKDSSTYGVDNIDLTATQTTTYLDLLRFDGDKPNNEKRLKHVTLRFDPLLSTDTLTVLYKINRIDFPAGTGVENGYKEFGSISGATSTNVGKVFKSFDPVMSSIDFYEIEFRIKLTRDSGATTSPTIYSITMDYDINDETRLGTK